MLGKTILDLARLTVETFVKTGRIISIEELEISDKYLLDNSAGAFVTLRKDGQLRGCIGTIVATNDNLALEIIQNAVSSCSKDPRFFPVREDELEFLEYSVDVLDAPEPIKTKEELDVKTYGVIVTNGYRRGLLLPNLDGVDTVDLQVDIALQKAGIHSSEPYTMQRFKVIRYE